MGKYHRLQMLIDRPLVSLKPSQRRMVDPHKMDHLGRDPHHQDHLQASLDLYQGRIDPLDQRVLLLDYHHHQDPLQDSQGDHHQEDFLPHLVHHLCLDLPLVHQ